MNIEQITQATKALLDLDEAKALVPHGLGGHAKRILTEWLEAATRIESDAKRIAELEVVTDMLLLCGECGGQKNGEAPAKYLRRLIDALVNAERELDTANANHRDMAARLKDMGTQLEQARSALAEERERNQWRTIESAPTNGDTFLAWEGSERGPFKCWWRDDWPYDESCWMDPQDSEPAPTHWKPLDIPDATAIRSGKPDSDSTTNS